MVENKNIRIVKEDAVVGGNCNKSVKTFEYGYDAFQYPFTVSFCSEGEYKVVIKGKRAEVIKVEDCNEPKTENEENETGAGVV